MTERNILIIICLFAVTKTYTMKYEYKNVNAYRRVHYDSHFFKLEIRDPLNNLHFPAD